MAVDGGNGRQGKGDDATQELVVIVAEECRVRGEAVEVEAVSVHKSAVKVRMSARESGGPSGERTGLGQRLLPRTECWIVVAIVKQTRDSRKELSDFALAGDDERSAFVATGFRRFVPCQLDVVECREELHVFT